MEEGMKGAEQYEWLEWVVNVSGSVAVVDLAWQWRTQAMVQHEHKKEGSRQAKDSSRRNGDLVR